MRAAGLRGMFKGSRPLASNLMSFVFPLSALHLCDGRDEALRGQGAFTELSLKNGNTSWPEGPVSSFSTFAPVLYS